MLIGYRFWVCLTAFFVVQTGMQACSRTFYAFSRDRGLPDKGLVGRITKNHVPLYSVVSRSVLVVLRSGISDLRWCCTVAHCVP